MMFKYTSLYQMDREYIAWLNRRGSWHCRIGKVTPKGWWGAQRGQFRAE